MVEPLCMCATILHFGYEMLLNSPCFESLELFWETVETLGAGVLAERHRSPGISPWRLHPVSSAPPPTPSHDPCFLSAMRWRAHSAVQWTEHRELRTKTKNSSQASSRYSVTGMRKAIQCEHKCYVCMESIFSQCLLCTHDSSQGAQKHCWRRCTHTLAGKPAQQHRAQENHCILCCEMIPNTLCHLNDLGFSAIRNWGAMLLSRIPHDV